ncbi:hypothetical protein USDA257_c43480 [Sinorhizobium fredii USDA 257]|uniref:Uncharacterized protein n=1 Tax=Sinorhizobium fredii (strain USDA 257) TaxID=1185652 RepID=I3XAI0_SINF2|nr:hypothetical protein USDA257_c43480 [Sinorhizobium fredii USDA 257]
MGQKAAASRVTSSVQVNQKMFFALPPGRGRCKLRAGPDLG